MQPDNIEQRSRAGRSRLPADPWEDAYLRFETPEEEIRKFIGRLKFMGAMKWQRNAKIVELFCGRGSGLLALHRLSFSQVEGIDLSPALAAEYAGPGKILVGDCRQLPFENVSKDVLIVQAVCIICRCSQRTLIRSAVAEARRVVTDDGLLLVIEPWLTPFLSLVHGLCRSRIVRVLSPKIDALATTDSLRT